jgi:hypothetical protein
LLNLKLEIFLFTNIFLLFYFILGLDGWSNPKSNSIYNFIITTPNRKEFLYSLKDFSAESHTADFLASKIQEVIEEIGQEKFAAVVSDNASAIAAARRKISETYPHIINIRCIAHFVNLISKDILGKYNNKYYK